MSVAEKRGKSVFILLAISMLAYFGFGLYHLAQFETSDEHYWVYEDPHEGRIFKYWNSVFSHNWKNTYINDKPGVTLAYISGLALFAKEKPEENLFKDSVYYRTYNPEEVSRVLFLFRLPQLIFIGIFSILFFWLVKKLTDNEWIALWSAIFMLLSPILLGISQIVNPDALLAPLSAAAVLSYLNYLKYDQKKFAFLSSFFLGLSLLTKYTSVILVPFFLLMLLIYIFFYNNGQSPGAKKIIKMALSYFFIVLGSFSIFSIFMPAVLVRPEYFSQTFLALSGARQMFLSIFGVIFLLIAESLFLRGALIKYITSKLHAFNGYATRFICAGFIALVFIVLMIWIADPKWAQLIKDLPFDTEIGVAFRGQPIAARIILELVPLVFSLTPLTLLAVLFLLGKTIFYKSKFSKIIVLFLFFAASFYLAVLLQNLLVTIRYSIILYPFFLILAAIGVWELFSWKRLQFIHPVWITTGIIVISFISLWETKPYYFNYTNALLPKATLVADAWGYGGYEAAQYLNSLPGAENLTVWADYNGFCPFFKGKCIKGMKGWKDRPSEDIIPDYFIKTRRGSIMYKGLWEDISSKYLYSNYENVDPVWQLAVNGRPKNYIKIIKYVSENN